MKTKHTVEELLVATPMLSDPKLNMVPFENEATIDVMAGCQRIEFPVHQHGFVALVDCMPRMVPEGRWADFAVAQAARTSTGAGLKTPEEDRALIRYLYRQRHSTPFEMVEFKWHMRMPIFVARQFIRHRTANVNEFSGRYAIIKEEFYRPEKVCQQSSMNKQGSGGEVEWGTRDDFMGYLARAEEQYAMYEQLCAKGVARETARIGLPLSIYTEWYWKNDLHNTLHFLSLRADRHAQQEIQDYAYPMMGIIKYLCPDTVEAFEDYHPSRGAILLSRLEVEAIRKGPMDVPPTITANKREQEEWLSKAERLGFSRKEGAG